MATTEQLAAIRLLIGAGALQDAEINSLIDQATTDGETDMLLAQASVWEALAARYHGLVDTSESGSSRSMSQMFKNATSMAAAIRAQITARDEVVIETSRRTTTRRITRV